MLKMGRVGKGSTLEKTHLFTVCLCGDACAQSWGSGGPASQHLLQTATGWGVREEKGTQRIRKNILALSLKI